MRERLAERGIDFELTAAAKAEVVREGYDPTYGARPLRRTLQRRIENELAKRVLGGDFKDGEKVVVDFAEKLYVFRSEPGAARSRPDDTGTGDDGVIEGEVVSVA